MIDLYVIIALDLDYFYHIILIDFFENCKEYLKQNKIDKIFVNPVICPCTFGKTAEYYRYVYKWEECKECKECKNLSVFEKIRIPTIYMRKQCHWFVTGTKESILCLIGSASNITGTDSWPWKELKENLEVNILAPKYICEKAVFYGSKETADFIKKLPGINSVYICEDKDKMYEYPPF